MEHAAALLDDGRVTGKKRKTNPSEDIDIGRSSKRLHISALKLLRPKQRFSPAEIRSWMDICKEWGASMKTRDGARILIEKGRCTQVKVQGLASVSIEELVQLQQLVADIESAYDIRLSLDDASVSVVFGQPGPQQGELKWEDIEPASWKPTPIERAKFSSVAGEMNAIFQAITSKMIGEGAHWQATATANPNASVVAVMHIPALVRGKEKRFVSLFELTRWKASLSKLMKDFKARVVFSMNMRIEATGSIDAVSA